MSTRFPYARIALSCEQALYDGFEVLNAKDAICLVTKHLFSYAAERGIVIYFDAEGTPLCASFTGIGNRGACEYDTAQTIQIGLLCGARSYILMHNHSNTASTMSRLTASVSDKNTTETIVKDCRPLGLYCLDSIVAGSYVKDEKVIPAYYSIKENETFFLKEEYLQAKAMLIDLNRIRMKSKALPIVRLTIQNHKYYQCHETQAVTQVENLIRDIANKYPHTMDLVVLTEPNNLPICILSTRDPNGRFDPADIARLGLFYNANAFHRVHQEPNANDYKTYVKSKKAPEDAREIAGIRAPVGVFFRDSIVFNITDRKYGLSPRHSVMPHSTDLISACKSCLRE